MDGGLPPVANPPPPRERRSSLQDAITIKSDKGAAAAPAAAAAAPSDLESLQALLEDRRLRPSNVPVPLKDDPVYGRFIKRKGLTSKAELILEMRDAKLETSVLDLDPDKPLKDQIESADPVNAAEKKRTEDMRRGVKAIFEIFDTAGKGALSRARCTRRRDFGGPARRDNPPSPSTPPPRLPLDCTTGLPRQAHLPHVMRHGIY